jgi:hypothetical protein
VLFIQAAAIAVIKKHKTVVVAATKNDSVANATPANTDVASHTPTPNPLRRLACGSRRWCMTQGPVQGPPRYEDSKRSKQRSCMICRHDTVNYCVGCGPGKGLCPGECLAKHIGDIINA